MSFKKSYFPTTKTVVSACDEAVQLDNNNNNNHVSVQQHVVAHHINTGASNGGSKTTAHDFGSCQVVWVKKLEEIYTFHQKIGSGQYGKVWTALDHITGNTVVCKIVDRAGDYIRELDHLISLRHCHGILPIKKAVFCTTKLCMEFELGESSLYHYVKKKHYESLKDNLIDALKLSYRIAKCLSEMHANGIVHRDLKSGNIVLLNEKAWIIDLGMSKRIIDPDASDVSFYEIVTCTYRAPELWSPYGQTKQDKTPESTSSCDYSDVDEEAEDESQDEEEEDEEVVALPYDSKIDVWSLGCILYEILMKDTPFKGDDEIDIRKRLVGHIKFVTGDVLSPIYPFPKVPKIDILKEIDNLLKPFVVPEQPQKLQKRDSKFMDLCDSMDLMRISPSVPRKSRSKFATVEIDDETTQLINIVKILLKGTLDPNPKTRFSAEDCLKILNRDYKPKAYPPALISSVPQMKMCNILPYTKCEEVLKIMFVGCDFYNINPRVVYLSLYNWIRVIGQSKSICRDFSEITIMLGCLKLASSYYGKSMYGIRALRRQIMKTHDQKTPRKETNCTSSILAVLNGKIWVCNPAEFRHHLISSVKWSSAIDQAIFTQIMAKLKQEFNVPDPMEIIEKAKEFLYS